MRLRHRVAGEQRRLHGEAVGQSALLGRDVGQPPGPGRHCGTLLVYKNIFVLYDISEYVLLIIS